MSVQTSIDTWWSELFASIDAQDADRFVNFLSEEAEFRFGNGPGVRGTSSIRQAVTAFFNSIDKSRHELIRTWQDQRTRVCQGNVTYTRSDRAIVTIPFVNVFEMDGEKISRYLIYVDIAPLFDTRN